MCTTYNIMRLMISYTSNYHIRRYNNNKRQQNKKQVIYNNNVNNNNVNNNVNSNNVNNNVNNKNNNINHKEDDPDLNYIESLENDAFKKEYLGEFLFKKIEQHPLAHEKNFTIDIIRRIKGMILGIEDIKEIYDITVNFDSLTSRINEALSLLESV